MRIQIILKSCENAWRHLAVVNCYCEMPKAIQRNCSLFYALSGPIKRLPVVSHQHLKSQDLARPIFQQIANGDEVAERLRHLLAFDLKKAVMRPVIRHHRRMEGATRLRDLIFMMRKYEIDAAAMDVKRFVEVLPRYCRAFDV